MATIKVSDIVKLAREVLQDLDAVRWLDSEFMAWLPTAYSEIIRVKPEANSARILFQCQTGTLQTLPSDASILISVVRNESVTATAIRPLERAVIDANTPDWHSTPNSGDVLYYIYEAQSPKVFYVYPQAVSGQTISIQYARIPQAHLSMDEYMALDDIYTGLILDYLLYRAYAKDALTGDATLANTYRDIFYTNLGQKPLYPARAITTI